MFIKITQAYYMTESISNCSCYTANSSYNIITITVILMPDYTVEELDSFVKTLWTSQGPVPETIEALQNDVGHWHLHGIDLSPIEPVRTIIKRDPSGDINGNSSRDRRPPARVDESNFVEGDNWDDNDDEDKINHCDCRWRRNERR